MSSFITYSNGNRTVRVNGLDPPRELNISGTGVTVTDNPSLGRYDIVISGGGGGGIGTITGASNLGTGEGNVYKDVNLGVIELKTIKAGTNISIVDGTDDITINNTYSYTPTAATTAAAGIVQLATPSSDTTAGHVVQASDTRLNNARTPTAHKTTHQSGGSDSIPLDTLAATTDITTLNSSTSAHGLLPKLDGISTHYLSGIGTWTAPTGGGNTPLAKGTITKSGDASTKVFSWPHGMVSSPPVYAWANPQSTDALGSYVVSFDATNITVTYQIAPPSGINNLAYEWFAMDVNGGGGTTPTGEANTYSTSGTGAAWTLTKSGVNLPFRSFIAGSNKLALTTNPNDLTLDVAEANLTLSNMGGSLLDSQISPSTLTTTNTKTVTGKTLDGLSNTIFDISNFTKYKIFKSGSTYYCRNNITGTIDSSSTTFETVLQYAVTNLTMASLYIEAGSYNYSAGFTGITFTGVSECTIYIDPGAILNVPSGYTGVEWLLTSGTGVAQNRIKIHGGRFGETGPVSRAWTFARADVTENNIAGATFENMYVRFAGTVFEAKIQGTGGYVNGCTFQNMLIDEFINGWVVNQVSTYNGTNGFHRNFFSNIIFQSNPTLSMSAFKNLNGQQNEFYGVKIWDMAASGAQGVTITANATNTLIVGGIMKSAIGYSDLGVNTRVIENADIILPNAILNTPIITSPTFVSTVLAKANLPSSVIYNDQANSFGTFNQNFKSGTLGIFNPAATKLYQIVGSAIAGNFTLTLPLITANDKFVLESFTQTLANKTLTTPTIAQILNTGTLTLPTSTDTLIGRITTDTLQNKTESVDLNTFNHSTTNAAGDLWKSDGTKMNRFPRGTANQVLAVNPGGTDVQWSTFNAENTGMATGTANGSTTVFNIAHGIGAIPSVYHASCASHTNLYTYTADLNNIIITFTTAPAASPSTITFYWRAVA